jgi:Calcineurin-like phosphoesterase
VVIVALLTMLLAFGCAPERPPGPPSGELIVAAGDIANCAGEGDEATAKLVAGIEGATVLTLGDNAYPDGSAQDFEECYEPSWGQFKERTRPIPGNHEYETEGARGYFDYFGEAAGDPEEGYYSYDLGSWHIVALNSNCGEGEIRCGPGSAQTEWLKEGLAANAADEGGCTLAYMHHPRFSSGEEHGSTLRWSRCGKHSMRRGRMWSSPATSTTTSASPRRTPRGGRTPSGVSESSWWAPGARATILSWLPSRTVKSTMIRATVC